MKLKRPDIFIMGFAVALALLGGVAWFDWRHTARTQETAELVAHTHEVQANSNRLLSLIQDIETGERGFVVTGDPAFLKPFESALKAVGEQRRKLEQLIRDAEQKANWSALEPLIAERIVLAQRIVDLRQNAGFEAARQEVASGRGKAVMDKIRAEFAQMDAKEQTLLDQRSAAAKREASAAQRRTGFGTSLSLVLLIAVFALLLRENRLRQRVQEQMAGNIKALTDFKAALDEHAIVAITDARGKIIYVNDKFCAISKYSHEELLGQDHRIINSGHHPKTLIRELWQTIGSGRVWKGEFKSRAKDGTFFWLDTSIVPFLDEHGKVTQYITIRTDITERKQAEEKIVQLNAELRVYAAQLEAANKELEAFSYSVSHDLRAPLRAVNGFAELVVQNFGPQLPDKGRHYLDVIRESAHQMGELIDDLLMFSRLSRQALEKGTVDTTRLVNECLGELAAARAGRQVEIRLGALPPCEADRSLLKQVWLNLLGNALKYTGRREHAVVEIGCTREPGGEVFFVRDNGTGFDMRYVHKLFGVFQRLHRADEFEGTGVGLAIVQRVVHRHGGRAWAEATVGRGATFYFTLQETITS